MLKIIWLVIQLYFSVTLETTLMLESSSIPSTLLKEEHFIGGLKTCRKNNLPCPFYGGRLQSILTISLSLKARNIYFFFLFINQSSVLISESVSMSTVKVSFFSSMRLLRKPFQELIYTIYSIPLTQRLTALYRLLLDEPNGLLVINFFLSTCKPFCCKRTSACRNLPFLHF